MAAVALVAQSKELSLMKWHLMWKLSARRGSVCTPT